MLPISHENLRDLASTCRLAAANLVYMATPRYKLVDASTPLSYHLVSRCVRGAWLCGKDHRTCKDYSHRKPWLTERLLSLAQFFAVEIDAYSVMSNHFHLVVYHDPKLCLAWSDEEVARRWVEAFPPTQGRQALEERKALARERLLGDRERLKGARRTLGSLSSFMKHLKQPIARRANKEDGCKGHFFEQRFYSGALLSNEAVLAAMAYVDLNPVRAKLAKHLEDCRETSVSDRLRENGPRALEEYLAPVASGLGDTSKRGPRFRVTLAEYIALLNQTMAAEALLEQDKPPPSSPVARWLAQVASLRKRQRAYGPIKELKQWITARGLRFQEAPLPN